MISYNHYEKMMLTEPSAEIPRRGKFMLLNSIKVSCDADGFEFGKIPPRGLFSWRGPQGRYKNSSRSLEHAPRMRCSAWKAPGSTTWNNPACARTRTNTCRKIGMTDRHLKKDAFIPTSTKLVSLQTGRGTKKLSQGQTPRLEDEEV